MPQTLMGVVRLVASPTTIVARILPLDNAELFNPCWTKFVLGTGTQPALELVMVTRPALPPQNFTRIFLYTVPAGGGVYYYPNQFPNPGNWNPINKIEVIGCGESGVPAMGPESTTSGGGGGAGAYASGDNVPVATFPVSYSVFPGTSVALFSGVSCVWGSSSWSGLAGAPGMVFAGCAFGGGNNAGGNGGTVVYPSGFRGGNGGNGEDSSFSNAPGGGGGGAGGPGGAGSNGTNATPTTFGSGGAANAGTNGGGTTASGAGVSGVEWGIAGTGGGGAGSINHLNQGGLGGSFGGGGGGSASFLTGSPGAPGGDGLIVITYVPLPSGMQAQILG